MRTDYIGLYAPTCNVLHYVFDTDRELNLFNQEIHENKPTGATTFNIKWRNVRSKQYPAECILPNNYRLIRNITPEKFKSFPRLENIRFYHILKVGIKRDTSFLNDLSDFTSLTYLLWRSCIVCGALANSEHFHDDTTCKNCFPVSQYVGLYRNTAQVPSFVFSTVSDIKNYLPQFQEQVDKHVPPRWLRSASLKKMLLGTHAYLKFNLPPGFAEPFGKHRHNQQFKDLMTSAITTGDKAAFEQIASISQSTQQCPNCKETKDLTKEYFNYSSRNFWQATCKKCSTYLAYGLYDNHQLVYVFPSKRQVTINLKNIQPTDDGFLVEWCGNTDRFILRRVDNQTWKDWQYDYRSIEEMADALNEDKEPPEFITGQKRCQKCSALKGPNELYNGRCSVCKNKKEEDNRANRCQCSIMNRHKKEGVPGKRCNNYKDENEPVCTECANTCRTMARKRPTRRGRYII